MDPENEVISPAAGEPSNEAQEVSLDDALRESLAEFDSNSAAPDGGAPQPSVAAKTAADAANTGDASKAGADSKQSASDPKVDAKGRVHGSDGKFLGKDGAPPGGSGKPAVDAAQAAGKTGADPAAAAAAGKPAAPDAAQQAAAAAAAAAPPQAEIVEGRDITKAPKSWKPDAAAEFEKLPRAAREEIHRREEAMFKGIEQYKGAANFGVEIAKVVQPYGQMFTAIGQTPAQLMNAAVNFEYGIRTAKTAEKKFEILNELAKSYGLELLQARPYIAAVGGATDGAQPDPKFMQLENEVKQLRERETARERQAREAQETAERGAAEAIKQEITAFAADPSNEFYSLVQEEVLAFVRQGLDLKPAYDKAIWANPVTRAKLIARQQDTEQREAAERAAAANKANVVNVTARATPQGKTAGKGTLDDALRDSINEYAARSA